MVELFPYQSVRVIIPPTGPSIESNRLLLRPVADRDIPALFAIRARPEVAKSNYPKTPFKSIEETKEWLASKIFTEGPDDIKGRSFNYSILDKSISEPEEHVIGYISINTVHPCPEIGYSLLPESWGKGYATEALQMLMKMWWDLPRRDVQGSDSAAAEEVEKVFAIAEKDNTGSGRVLAKCGFEVNKELTFENGSLNLWALNKPENYQEVDGQMEYRYIQT